MKNAFKTFYLASINLLKEIINFIKRILFIDAFFKPRNIPEIIVAYFLVIIIIIIKFVDVPYNFNPKATTVAIYGTPDRIGESILNDRLVLAAKNNGWNVIGGAIPEILTNNFFLNHLSYMALSTLNYIYKPKFNLHSSHHARVIPIGYNISYLNVPNDMVINRKGNFDENFTHLANYDAYVDIHSVTNKHNPLLKQVLAKYGIKAPVIPLYFAESYTKYSPAKREKVLVVGSLWGANRESLRIFNALKTLANENLLVAFGLKPEFEELKEGYRGRIEGYSKSDKNTNLLKIQKKYGISLVLHNLEHMIENIPTNRVSESIAAGAIVISDNNGFVRKFYGDNVLYIDTLQQTDEIYKQIKHHIDWIKANPAEAEKKTRAAYNILMSEFLMETSLKKLEKFVDLQHPKYIW